MWYTGDAPAKITLEFDDGTMVGPVGPNEFLSEGGVHVTSLSASCGARRFTAFRQWRSLRVRRRHRPRGLGRVRIPGTAAKPGVIDLYTAIDGTLTSPMPFSDHLTPGRLTDFASTSLRSSPAHVLHTDTSTSMASSARSSARASRRDVARFLRRADARWSRVRRGCTAPGHNAFAAFRNRIGPRARQFGESAAMVGRPRRRHQRFGADGRGRGSCYSKPPPTSRWIRFAICSARPPSPTAKPVLRRTSDGATASSISCMRWTCSSHAIGPGLVTYAATSIAMARSTRPISRCGRCLRPQRPRRRGRRRRLRWRRLPHLAATTRQRLAPRCHIQIRAGARSPSATFTALVGALSAGRAGRPRLGWPY